MIKFVMDIASMNRFKMVFLIVRSIISILRDSGGYNLPLYCA